MRVLATVLALLLATCASAQAPIPNPPKQPPPNLTLEELKAFMRAEEEEARARAQAEAARARADPWRSPPKQPADRDLWLIAPPGFGPSPPQR